MTNWQTKKLSDVMDFVPTGAHSRNDMAIASFDTNQVFNIHYGDIHTKYATYVDFRKDSVPVLKENDVRTAMLLRDGDLVVADASEDYAGVGSVVELRNVGGRKVIGGLHTFALRSKDNELASGFAGIILKNPATRKRLMQVSVYSKVYGLTKNSIGNVNISYPDKPEQDRIVSVLEVWDEYLEKLEQKIALKEQLKKGLMQQLLTGERRLPGFNGEWLTYSFKDICEIKRGGSPRPIEDYIIDNSQEGYAWLRIGDIPAGNRKVYGTSQKIKKEGLNKTTLARKGDFILSNSMSFGRPYIMDIDACIHDGWLALRNIDEKINTWFLYYLLLSEGMQNKFRNMSAGSGVKNLKKETVEGIVFAVPPLTEQEAVVAILENLDVEITFLNAVRVQRLRQKKYLLKNLITGTIRISETLTRGEAN